METVQPASVEEPAETFKLRAGSFTIQVIALSDLRNPDFFTWLKEKLARAHHLLDHAPIIIDLDEESLGDGLDLGGLAELLKSFKLNLIGVQNGTEEQDEQAAAAGLSIFPVWRSLTHSEAEPPAPARNGDDGRDDVARSSLITGPVRSGGQVYAEGSDLVALSTVSAGAEIKADGHIHVYGALRGRAFAGARGDRSARIFCREFDAELVSIAGLWRVRENINENLIGRPAQVFLENDKLIIKPHD